MTLLNLVLIQPSYSPLIDVHGIMEGEAAGLADELVPETWQWKQLSIV